MVSPQYLFFSICLPDYTSSWVGCIFVFIYLKAQRVYQRNGEKILLKIFLGISFKIRYTFPPIPLFLSRNWSRQLSDLLHFSNCNKYMTSLFMRICSNLDDPPLHAPLLWKPQGKELNLKSSMSSKQRCIINATMIIKSKYL